MSQFGAGKTRLDISAAGLLALFRGEDSPDAEVGALTVADMAHCLRVVREFLQRKR